MQRQNARALGCPQPPGEEESSHLTITGAAAGARHAAAPSRRPSIALTISSALQQLRAWAPVSCPSAKVDLYLDLNIVLTDPRARAGRAGEARLVNALEKGAS